MPLPATDPGEVRVRAAIDALAAGRAVVVVGDAGRDDEGDLVFAASRATPQLVAFTVRHTSGFLCVALAEPDCTRLGLAPMYRTSIDRFGTDHRVTVDLHGTGTGISARSRAATIAALAHPGTHSADLTRPGHVVPLLAHPGGVLTRPGRTEAAVDLARLAGLPAAGALCGIVSTERPGEMARGRELHRFAATHDLVLVTVEELIRFRRRTEPQVRRVATTSLPTRHGHFTALGYASVFAASEHLALVAGPLEDISAQAVPVHVHTECVAADVFGATTCDCRRALDQAMARFAAARRGVIVYLRHDGPARGCGLPRADQDTATRSTEAEAVRAIVHAIIADLGTRGTTVDPPFRIEAAQNPLAG